MAVGFYRASYAQPEVAARELRPSRAWYWVAGVIGFAGLVGGVIAFVQGIVQVVRIGGVDQFEVGEEARFEVDPDDPVSIYVLEREDAGLPFVDCAARPVDGGTVRLETPVLDGFIANENGSWVSIYDVEVTERARYAFDCTGDPTAVLGLGERSDPAALVGRLGLAGLLAFVGLGAAIVICLAVGIRRSSHKRRLLAERRPRPPSPPTGWYMPPPGPGAGPPPAPPPPPADFVPPG